MWFLLVHWHSAEASLTSVYENRLLFSLPPWASAFSHTVVTYLGAALYVSHQKWKLPKSKGLACSPLYYQSLTQNLVPRESSKESAE
jgi:hypothetical protein